MSVEPVPFRVRRRVVGDCDVIAVHGDLDIHTKEWVTRAALVERDVSRTLVLDLTEVVFIDSSGVGALVTCRREADRNAAEVRLVCPEGSARRLLGILGVAEVMALHATLAEALGVPADRLQV